jgi:hypothetical protein
MAMRWLGTMLLLMVMVGGFSAGQDADADSLEGFQPLFNSNDLTGWKLTAGRLNWGFDEGVLYTTGTENNFLLSEKEYADFEIRFDYMVPKEGVSGLALRAPGQGNPAYAGLEIQLVDDANIANLKPMEYTGSIYDVVPAAPRAKIEPGKWNHVRIVAQERHILVEVNSVKILDADLKNYRHLADKHPGVLRSKGHLGFRSQKGRVEFCNLFIKPL